jgi:hypothetical protein
VPQRAARDDAPVTEPPPRLLAPIRARREALRTAIGGVEQALATPLGVPGWRAGVAAALVPLRAAFDAHVAGSDGPTGLYASVVDASPRLHGPATKLVAEHPELAARLAEVEALAADEDADRAELRDRATSLLGRLVRHRQRGGDLLFEAFSLDLGGED